MIYRAKFVSEKNNVENLPISSYSNYWNLSRSHSQLLQHSLVLIHSCGSTASFSFIVVVAQPRSKVLEARQRPLMTIKKTHTISLYSEKHTQYHKSSVKLVLKRSNDLLYIKIQKFHKFLKKCNILFMRNLLQTIINRDSSSIGLYQI